MKKITAAGLCRFFIWAQIKRVFYFLIYSYAYYVEISSHMGFVLESGEMDEPHDGYESFAETIANAKKYISAGDRLALYLVIMVYDSNREVLFRNEVMSPREFLIKTKN